MTPIKAWAVFGRYNNIQCVSIREEKDAIGMFLRNLWYSSWESAQKAGFHVEEIEIVRKEKSP